MDPRDSEATKKGLQGVPLETREAGESLLAILDSLPQGFLIFDRTGRFLEICSRACEKLLGTDPRGKYLWDVLTMDQKLLTNWLEVIFSNRYPFEMVAQIGPCSLVNAKGLHIQLDYFPARSEAGAIENVVLVATDSTAEIIARQNAESEKQYTRRVIEIVRHRDQFIALCREIDRLIRTLKRSFSGDGTRVAFVESSHAEFMNCLHTLKGSVGAFGMGEIQDLAHELESLFIGKGPPPATGDPATVRQGYSIFETLEAAFHRYLKEAEEILGGSALSSRGDSTPDPRELGLFLELLDRATGLDEVRREFIRVFVARPPRLLLDQHNRVLEASAPRLNKQMHPLRIESSIRVLAEPLAPLFSSLVHAIRNSVDHGIETIPERIKSGKDPRGLITITIERRGRDLAIEVRDDGRGIDPTTIRSKASAELGIDAGAMTDHDVIQLVFQPGFSTAESAGGFSGRGLGMCAIKAEVDKLGGTITLHSTPGAGSSLRIAIPDRGFCFDESPTPARKCA